MNSPRPIVPDPNRPAPTQPRPGTPSPMDPRQRPPGRFRDLFLVVGAVAVAIAAALIVCEVAS